MKGGDTAKPESRPVSVVDKGKDDKDEVLLHFI